MRVTCSHLPQKRKGRPHRLCHQPSPNLVNAAIQTGYHHRTEPRRCSKQRAVYLTYAHVRACCNMGGPTFPTETFLRFNSSYTSFACMRVPCNTPSKSPCPNRHSYQRFRLPCEHTTLDYMNETDAFGIRVRGRFAMVFLSPSSSSSLYLYGR